MLYSREAFDQLNNYAYSVLIEGMRNKRKMECAIMKCNAKERNQVYIKRDIYILRHFRPFLKC